jgi:hypothetical protein
MGQYSAKGQLVDDVYNCTRGDDSLVILVKP